MRYLDLDTRAGHRAADVEKGNVAALQLKLDTIAKEHGDTYAEGIQPVFEPLKARHFDSSWNWVHQDALLMWYDILHGHVSTVDRDITARHIAIINQADKSLLEYMQYYVDCCDSFCDETYPADAWTSTADFPASPSVHGANNGAASLRHATASAASAPTAASASASWPASGAHGSGATYPTKFPATPSCCLPIYGPHAGRCSVE